MTISRFPQSRKQNEETESAPKSTKRSKGFFGSLFQTQAWIAETALDTSLALINF